jgi:hypothetical protein
MNFGSSMKIFGVSFVMRTLSKVWAPPHLHVSWLTLIGSSLDAVSAKFVHDELISFEILLWMFLTPEVCFCCRHYCSFITSSQPKSSITDISSNTGSHHFHREEVGRSRWSIYHRKGLLHATGGEAAGVLRPVLNIDPQYRSLSLYCTAW